MPAGVRLTFATDATAFAGACEAAPRRRPSSSLCDGELVGAAAVAGQDGVPLRRAARRARSASSCGCPSSAPSACGALDLDGGTSSPRPRTGGPRWVTYGSSITQCRTAAGPAQTWPAIVARERRPAPHLPRLRRAVPPGRDGGPDPCAASRRTTSPCASGSTSTAPPRSARGPSAGASSASCRSSARGTRMSPTWSCRPSARPPGRRRPTPSASPCRRCARRWPWRWSASAPTATRNLHYVDGLSVFGPDLADRLLPIELHPDAEGYLALGTSLRPARRRRLLRLTATRPHSGSATGRPSLVPAQRGPGRTGAAPRATRSGRGTSGTSPPSGAAEPAAVARGVDPVLRPGAEDEAARRRRSAGAASPSASRSIAPTA